MSDEPFHTWADLLTEPVLLVSEDGIVLDANRAVGTRLGLPPESLAGRPLQDFARGDAEQVARYLTFCARSRQLVLGAFELQSATDGATACRAEGALFEPRADGRPARIFLRLRPKEDTIQRFLLLNQRIDELNREVSRRRRAEADLKDQREWLRVTLESIGDAVIATDTAGRVTFMNPVAERLTGWPGSEAAGLPLADVFRIVNEETLATVESPVDKVLREGVSAGLANHTLLISRDGDRLPIDDCASPIQDGGGAILGVVLIFHDVAERREMERELVLRAERLVESDRRKDEFLAMLSHELRNPLAPIRNALHLLATPGVAGDQIERARKMMERQVKHMVRLVDDLLDVSRITRDRIELHREALDMAEVLDRVEQATRSLFDERGIGFEVQAPPPGNLRVSADPVRLEQVLMNLLQNAAKFTPSGGRVEIAGRREGGDARITVRDTGAGIDPELLPHLFEAFVQADRSIDRSQGGLGLGLTLVQRLVELHGGSVSAESAGPGQGSEFTVRLPLLEEPGEAGAEPSPQAAGAGPAAGLNLLVVDDNQDVVESLSIMVEMWGHRVQTATDGPSALDQARRERPDAILLDIGLPGMDGYEVARRLRADLGLTDVSLVAMTGYGQEEDRRRSREAGFDLHLVKPVDPPALKELLARLATSSGDPGSAPGASSPSA